MTQKPKYYFQGFEGARQVQSMMIDFMRDLCFFYQDGIVLHLNLHAESLAENHYFDLFAVGKSKLDFQQQNVRIYANDTTSKVFVAPECEGFFDGKGWKETDRQVYRQDALGNLILETVNGKRIWMPQTDSDNDVGVKPLVF